MDELHSCMLILLSGIMAQVQSLSLTVTKGLLKTSYIREDGTIFIHCFTAETQFYNKKEFMSTDSNKQRLMWMVSDELVKAAVEKSLHVYNTQPH